MLPNQAIASTLVSRLAVGKLLAGQRSSSQAVKPGLSAAVVLLSKAWLSAVEGFVVTGCAIAHSSCALLLWCLAAVQQAMMAVYYSQRRAYTPADHDCC
jgi:hypothetical protein